MNIHPKVSILIPCYNAKRWIGQTIKSALGQTYSNIEVIVVDDGSTDGSLAVIQSFRDRIYWKTGPNRGGNVARNRLLELSSGDWLQYLDADDYLLPAKIDQQIQKIRQSPDVDILYSPSILEYWENETSRQEILPIPAPYDPWILLARWYLPQTGSPLWRKQAIVDVGGWKVNQPCCQEHELYLRLLIAGKQFQYFEDAGSVYRQWSEGTVCKRDQPEVFRQRLAIEDQLESYLHSQNLLTDERQYAINQARFECARKLWPRNQTWAKQIAQEIQQGDKGFLPSGSAAPTLYQWFYRWFGFEVAEQFASAKRRVA